MKTQCTGSKVAIVTLILFIFLSNAVAGENKALKSDLERALSGTAVVSKIPFGGRATPAGYRADYPVNTVVNTETGEISYRVEWGLMRADVGAGEILRRFDRGTTFKVGSIDLKDDRLELKLESGSGDSAKLKLVLGQGWQSRIDSNAVIAQLARVLNIASTPAVTASATVSIGNTNTNNASSTSTYQRSTSTPTIPGRISESEMQAVLNGFDSAMNTAFSPALQNAAAIARALKAVKKSQRGYGGSVSQEISSLEDRLGKNLMPRSVEDIAAMNELYRRCIRYAQINQTRDESRRLLSAGAGNSDYENLLLNESAAAELYRTTHQNTQAAARQQHDIKATKQQVLYVESAFDRNDLRSASEKLVSLAANTSVAELEPVRKYLAGTSSLRQDLHAYMQLSAMAEQSSEIGQQIRFLNSAKSYAERTDLPITKSFLDQRVNAGLEALRAKLVAIPDINHTNINRPSEASQRSNSISSIITALDRVNQSLSGIDGQLSACADLRNLVDNHLLENAKGTLNSGDSALLQSKADHLKEAMQLRASLASDKSALEGRLSELNTAERERIARAERQQPALERYASQLTVIHGRRFKVNQGVSINIIQHMLDQIPKQQFADLVPLYKAIDGLDGSTTLEALGKSRAIFVGKYYMLQGDVFQIQADRDYPREGLNAFSLFGQVRLVGDYYVPVNVDCISAEKVPPYRVAPILSKIVDFRVGQNRAGKAIIIPVVEVLAVASPSSCCGYPEEIIINQR